MVDGLKPASVVALFVVLGFPASSPAQWIKAGAVPVQGAHCLEVIGDRLYVPAHTGLLVSTDRGATWKRSIPGLAGAAVQTLAVRGDDLVVGTYEDGAFVSHDDGETWSSMSSGLPSGPVGDASLTAVEIGGTIYLGTSAGVFASSDGGVSWVPLSRGLPAFRVVEDLAAIGTTLFAATFSDSVYSLEEGGDEWLPMSAGLPSKRYDRQVECLATIGDTLLAGTDKGLFRFDFESGFWEKTSAAPTSTSISDLTSHEGSVFAATERGVLRSDDRGGHWSESSSGLPAGESIRALLSVGSRLFAGTLEHGVFVSSDNGLSWARFNGDGPLPSDTTVDALAALGDRLFAGTEEGVFVSGVDGGGWYATMSILPEIWQISGITSIGDRVFAGNSGYTGGVVRSPDKGKTWLFPDDDPVPDDQVVALGSVGDRLLASTLNDGALMSSDDGESWSPIGTPIDEVEVNTFLTTGSVVYGGSDVGVFTSADRGDSWSEVAAFVSGLEGSDVCSLENVDGRLFALTNRGVFRLENEDATWVACDPSMQWVTTWCHGLIQSLDDALLVAIGNRLFLTEDLGRTWENISLEAVPDAGIATAVASSRGRLFVGSGKGAWVSSDRGASWAPLSSGLTRLAHVSAFDDSSGSLLALTDSGLYSLDDGEDRWIEVSTDIKGGYSDPIAVAVDRMYVGTSAGLSRSTDGGKSWAPIGAGLGYSPEIREITVTDAGLFVITELGVFRSMDRGETFSRVFPAAWPNEVYSLEVMGDAIFVAGQDGVYRSADRGEHWTPMNAGLPVDIDVRSFAHHGSTILAGTDKGVIRSTNGGTTWEAIKGGPRTMMTVTAVATDGDHLYAGGEGGVFLSIDRGASWRRVGPGLPLGDIDFDLQALTILGDHVFAGTSFGIYRSPVDGGSWTRLPGDGGVTSFHRFGDAVFAGTAFGVSVSEDRGETWVPAVSGFNRESLGELTVAGGTLLVGTEYGIFRFDNEEREWKPFDTIQQVWVTISSLAVLDDDLIASTWRKGIYVLRDGEDHWNPSNNGINYPIVTKVLSRGGNLFADVYEQGIFRSMDRGRTWSRTDFGLPTAYYGKDLMDVEGELFVTSGDEIFVSDDGGSTWVLVNAASPGGSQILDLVAVGPCLFAGSPDDVFRSRDRGRSWEIPHPGLPDGFEVVDLAAGNGDVFVLGGDATVWRLPSACD